MFKKRHLSFSLLCFSLSPINIYNKEHYVYIATKGEDADDKSKMFGIVLE